jgi:late competence protein required for DNA uptake (superfamily II DNA/RNA helicase)
VPQQIQQDRSPKPANHSVNPTTIACPQCGSAERIKNTTFNGIDKCYCQSCLYYFSPCSTDDIWLVSKLGLNFPPHDRRGESVLNFSPIDQ